MEGDRNETVSGSKQYGEEQRQLKAREAAD